MNMVHSEMEAKKDGSDHLKSIIPLSNNPMQIDVKAPSLSCLQFKENAAFFDEYAPKVRKPYTITKQREKWSEEEHSKFLEALQLYGRAWRRIEEHIGTKTAVQIRSHAQKFFTKVVRLSSGSDGASSIKDIQIPPPRPKRKPSHPYPRKSGNFPGKGEPFLKHLDGGPSLQIPSLCEQENRSSTSVLSVLGPDSISSVLSFLQTTANSATKSAAGQENAGQKSARNAQQEKNIQLSSEKEGQSPTLKLFGKTVLLNCGESENVAKFREPICSVRSKSDPSGGMFLMNSSTCQVPLWALYRNFPFISSTEQQAVYDEETQGEDSSTGTNNSSVSEVGTGDQYTDVADSMRNRLAGSLNLRPGDKSAFRSWKASSVDSCTGFRPYKRYRFGGEKELNSKVNDDKESQMVRLCL